MGYLLFVYYLLKKNVVNRANICFLATQAREYLSKLGDLSQTLIFAKIENVEVFSSKSSYIIS
jgi:hypothetical protein